MSLLQAIKNRELVVKDIFCCDASRQRLMDLGVFKGARLKLLSVAPLGDPMVFEVNDSKIAIRKSDAKNIIVEQESQNS